MLSCLFKLCEQIDEPRSDAKFGNQNSLLIQRDDK